MKIGTNCNTEISKYSINENTIDYISTEIQIILDKPGLYFIYTGGYFTNIAGRYYNTSTGGNKFDTLIDGGVDKWILDYRDDTHITLKKISNNEWVNVSLNLQHRYNGIRITFNTSANYKYCIGHIY